MMFIDIDCTNEPNIPLGDLQPGDVFRTQVRGYTYLVLSATDLNSVSAGLGGNVPFCSLTTGGFYVSDPTTPVYKIVDGRFTGKLVRDGG